jgi:hypothetical protein
MPELQPGAVFKLNPSVDESCRLYFTALLTIYTKSLRVADFKHLGATTWNVVSNIIHVLTVTYATSEVRAECDELMLRHAATMGVQVFENVRVKSIEFQDDDATDSQRPVSASWEAENGASGVIKFDYLVDASGRAGLMSNKYLKNRLVRESLRNVAVYGYWKNAHIYDKGGHKANAAYFEAMHGTIPSVCFL